MREFGCGFLAEAMGFEDICSFPVRKPEDLEREVERLAEWLRAHGEKLVSATDADWDRASEIANEKFKRKEQVRRNSEAYAKIDQTRQKAEAAHLAANLQGVIDAYEEIEDWLVPSEMEMLEKARRALAQKSGRS